MARAQLASKNVFVRHSAALALVQLGQTKEGVEALHRILDAEDDPTTTLLGAALMAALIVTTAFTQAFSSTLEFGVPFLGLLVLAYYLLYRRHAIHKLR